MISLFSSISKRTLFIVLAIALCVVILLPLGVFSVSYFSPYSITNPEADHLHFRMQIINNGEYIDFSQDKFQESYMPGACSAELTETPIHFHDGEDQIVHVHWQNITGGQVLKYYGYNAIGGFNDVMGYAFDEVLAFDGGVREIPIRGDLLDLDDETFWVYEGGIQDGTDTVFYNKRSKSDFIDLTLEEFFDTESIIKIQKRQAEEAKRSSLLAPITAYAHGDDHGSDKLSDHSTVDKAPYIESELAKINNLLGNVVIFIQETEPSSLDIVERFQNLTPLKPSSCGG